METTSYVRLLLCTSPLQVVNARIAMDYNALANQRYLDIIVIVHPILTEESRLKIRKLASLLNYANVIECYNPSHLQSDIYIGDIPLVDILKQVKEVYTRKTYSDFESQFVNYLLRNTKKYGIDDGLANYAPWYWYYLNAPVLCLKNLQSRVFWWLITHLLIDRVCDPKLFSKREFSPWYKFDENFSNLPRKGCIQLQRNFSDTIKYLEKRMPCDKTPKVLIFGSYLTNSSEVIDRKIAIYNSLILLIQDRHCVESYDVWYKPHPRLPNYALEQFKNHLNCKIVLDGGSCLGEIELCNPNLLAVYGVSSTCLLFAKTIFNVESYFIDLSQETIFQRPYHLAREKKIFQHYNMPMIDSSLLN